MSLDFIVVFLGGFYFLLNWDQSAILYFFIFFLGCFGYLWLDSQNKYQRYKRILFFSMIAFLVGVTTVSEIFLKIGDVHDGQIQIEAALNFLSAGKNPYAKNYTNTKLGEIAPYINTTQGVVLPNPALNHLVYLPFHLLFSLPFQQLFNGIFGFFDERIVYLALFVISLFVLFDLPQKKENKFLLTALSVFNPLFLIFMVTGRDDIFVLTWLILTIWCLKKEKITWSAVFLALACTSKQTAWFLVPFYYAYLYLKNQNIKNLVKKTWVFPMVFVLLMAPFLLWNPKAFIEDIYSYIAGGLVTSYPINGFGFSVMLYRLGVVKSITDYLPAWIYQIPITGAVFYYLVKRQRRQNTISLMVGNFAILLLVYSFLARFFHDNYVGFIAQLFLISYFLNVDMVKKGA